MAFTWLGSLCGLSLAVLTLSGCSKGSTSLLLEVTGDPNVTSIGLVVNLSTGAQVSRTLPLADPLPGRVVIELPDVAVIVTIDATGTAPTVEYTAHEVVTSKPHQQLLVPIQLGEPATPDLRVTPDGSTADLVGVDGDAPLADLAVTDGMSDDLADGMSADLRQPGLDLPGLDLPANSLVVLAGQYGGQGWHDDVGMDARFTQLEGAVRVGNTLYVAEHYTDRIRTIDLTTGQTGSLGTSAADHDLAPNSCGPAGLASDGSAFLYVACFDQHTVSKLEIATGVLTVIVGAPSSSGGEDGGFGAARFFNPWGLAFDASGFLWVSDSGNKKLRKIDLSGPTVSTPALVNFSATDMGAATTWVEPHGMTRNGAELFVTNGGGVVRVDPLSNVVTPFVAASKLDTAADVAVVGSNAYVLDYGLNALWRFPLASPQTGTVVAGGNIYARDSVDGVGLAARFQNPEYLVAGADSNDLFIVEAYAVRRIALDTSTVTTFAGRGEHAGFRDGADPLLRTPNGVLWDGDDTIYFTEYEGARIRKYTISTQQVALVAGTGDSDHLDGPALSAKFYGAAGLALDSDGNLYIAEDLVHTVRKLDKISGNVSTIAGLAGVDGTPGADGLAGTDNRLGAPWGLVFDGAHTLFVSERASSVVRAIDLDTPTYLMSLLVGSGIRDSQDNVNGKLAHFDGPSGLAYDRTRQLLYITETNNTVRRADLSTANRSVTTVSGIVYGPFSTNVPPGDGGPLASTRHRTPSWIALSASGNDLYVSNTEGQTIQRLDLQGNVSQTIVGAPLAAFVKPGPLPGRLSVPEGVALTPLGLVIAGFAENVLLVATGIAP